MRALSIPITNSSVILYGLGLRSRPRCRTGPCFIELVAEGKIPWILRCDRQRFQIRVLPTFSRCIHEGVRIAVEFSRILLRVFAGCKSRSATAEAKYRWSTEIRCFVLCPPTSSVVADGLCVRAVLQPVENIRCSVIFDKSDVDGGIVQIRDEVVLD